ncbi:MAG: Type secretion system outer membrane protein SpiA precursor [Pseudomonadota bacterium]|jgi:type III secretion protein C
MTRGIPAQPAALLAVGLLIATLALAATQSVVHASSIEWRQSKVPLVATDMPIEQVLDRIAAGEGLRVRVDPRVRGTLTLEFDGSPAGLLRQLETLFGCVAYFDGSTLHVTPVDRNATAMVRLDRGSGAAFEASLKRLGIADPRFPIRYDASTGVAMVSGPPRYIELVREAARNGRMAQDADDEEVRVFPLHYATARDRTMKSGSENTVVPGVASLMRAIHHGSETGGPSGPAAPVRPSNPSTAPKSRLRDAPGGPIEVPPPPHEKFEELLSRFNPLGAPQAGNPLPQIHADPRQNAVVVRDRSSRMEAHQQLVRLLDVRPRMIELHIRIIEAETAFVPGPDPAASGIGAGIGPAPAIRSIDAVDATYTTNASATRLGVSRDAPGGIAMPPRSGPVPGRVRVVAEPRLVAMDNTVAELANMRAFTAPGGMPNSDATQLEAGLRLRILPQSMIEPDGTRRIQLSVTVHDGLVGKRSGEGEDSNTSHSLTTAAILRPGESMMVGGMSYDYQRSPLHPADTRSSSGGVAAHGRSERAYIITPRFIDEGAP